jgi:hypothetical protein
MLLPVEEYVHYSSSDTFLQFDRFISRQVIFSVEKHFLFAFSIILTCWLSLNTVKFGMGI